MTGLEQNESRHAEFREIVNWLFSDDLMIALAATLAVSVILQLFFEFSLGMRAILEYLNYFIIAMFIAEYGLKLYVAESRASFIANPTHILDLIIILLALFDLSGRFSMLPYQAQLSPILRLLRVLPRALLALFLAGRTAKRIKDKNGDLTPPKNLQIFTFDTKGRINPNKACSVNSSENPIWIDFQNIKSEDLDSIENITKIPRNLLEIKLLKESFPRIDADTIKNILMLFLWDTQISSEEMSRRSFKTSANNMLIFFNDDIIMTLSRGGSNLFSKISNDLSKDISKCKNDEFTDKILHALLHQKMKDYSEIVRMIEQKTIEFEEIPVDETSPHFLEETFKFKKEILKISNNLWHFQNVLRQLNDDNIIKQFNIGNKKDFENLNVDSKYLYDNAQNIKESLISLIELHTNTVSYDMNKVMKVIAVITCIAIIPSMIGGLLGVNLQEGNFPIKLGEVIFIAFALMLLGVYAFYKMDWLK
jgi:Mg2+ and Co2+ transporter CorA